jgi:hypothetical protein
MKAQFPTPDEPKESSRSFFDEIMDGRQGYPASFNVIPERGT